MVLWLVRHLTVESCVDTTNEIRDLARMGIAKSISMLWGSGRLRCDKARFELLVYEYQPQAGAGCWSCGLCSHPGKSRRRVAKSAVLKA